MTPPPAFRPEMLELNALLREVWDSAQPACEAMGIRFVFTPSPAPVYTAADGAMLTRAIHNLLSNSMKFSPERELRLELVRSGSVCRIRFLDEGAKLPPAPFTRYLREPGLEDPRSGLGMGLKLVRDAARAHRGTVLMTAPGGDGLLTELRAGLDEREKLHGREYILSVALGAGNAHLNAIDPARLNGLLDQAVVMAYDLCGFDRMTGHHAGLYPDAGKSGTGAHAVQKLIDGGLHPGRILLGMPAYGRVWRQVTGGGDGLHQRAATSGNRTISFDKVQQLEADGYTRHYDDEAQAATWFNGTDFVSAEDERSIAYKGKWLQEKGLQGAAVWQYTQDASGDMLAMLAAALEE